jgi:hypothetical protein
MKKTISSDIKYPNVKDFDNIFCTENIIFTDFNIIASKNYNRIDNIV